MTQIQLVRQPSAAISDTDREAVRRVLFGAVDGLGDIGKKRWRRFLTGLLKLEPGEIVDIVTRKQRSGPFHRRHMKLETRVFEAQERIAEFEQFRLWLKLGAGFVDWMPGPKGGVFPVPKSIAYDQLEEDDFREFHDRAIAFLRTPHACKYLWPKLPEQQQGLAIESVLSEFGE
jgi:hypothetical protein